MRAFKLNFVHERGGSSVASFGICTGSDRADSLDCASSIAFNIGKGWEQNNWKLKNPKQSFTNIFVFYVLDPMKR